MNFKTAVVEDDAAARDMLAELVERYAEEHGHGVQVRRYADAYAFFGDYKQDFDVLLLDIDMPGMNGMEAAEKVRAAGDDAIIVFVTNMAQYAVAGYSVRALDFILKPVTAGGFMTKFDRVCRELSHRIGGGRIRLSNRSDTRSVNVGDIKYVEASNHDLVYHLFDGDFRVRGTIAEAERSLMRYHFVRCNNCYLVNLKYVEDRRGDDIIVAGEELRMSRSRRAAFMTELARYIGGSV
ncbi:MAG TPA: LytTR family DNA-binding domain-containing protein [Firmicutes bacterium]|nr:LytTR family DNA-binding domain-containing protein [Bacillota bacterium]